MSELDEDAIIAAMVGRSLLDASHDERDRRRRNRACRCAIFRCRFRIGTAGGRCWKASASTCTPAKSSASAACSARAAPKSWRRSSARAKASAGGEIRLDGAAGRHPLAARCAAPRHRAGDRGPQDAGPASAGVDHRQCRPAAGRAPGAFRPPLLRRRGRACAQRGRDARRALRQHRTGRPARCRAATSRRS